MSKIATKKIPKVTGFPIIGNSIGLYRDPLELCVQAFKKYGSVYRIATPFDKIIVLAGLEANQFLAEHADQYLCTSEIWGPYNAELGANQNMLSINGEKHLAMRHVMKRGYSPVVLVGNEAKTLVLMDEWFEKLKTQQEFNVVEFFQDITVDILGILLAGKRPTGYQKDIKLFLKTVLNVTVIKMWPKSYLKKKDYLKAKERIKELAKESLVYNQSTKRETPNLIDDVLEAIEDGRLENFSDNDMVITLLTPYTAGIDTVANNAAIIFYLLTQDRQLFEQVKKEADLFFKDGSFNVKDLRFLSVMRRVTMETLRRYPIAPVVPRTVKESFEFKGYHIPKGHLVYMAQGVAHFQEELFKDPYKFDIDRYTAERKEHKTKGAWSPFSIGAHKCLGMRLGETMIMLISSYMVHKLDFECIPKDYKLKFTSLPVPGPSAKFKGKVF